MYEVDFTGWDRTPENIKMLKGNKWKRFKFHLNRVVKSIKYKRWYGLKYCFFDLLRNSKNL